MHLIRQLPDAAPAPTAVAIGNFDGLHHGHKAVIDAMQAAAAAQGLVPTVLTFEPHPRRLFQPHGPAFRIERLRDKLARLRAAGVQQVVMPRFDAAFARISAQDFLDKVLGEQLGARVVVTGENFVFGHQRQGDSQMLKLWGNKHNIQIVTVSPVLVDGQKCSSSAIRAAIAAGQVRTAAQLLGHDYRLRGRVVHGDGRGRTLGFATANVALPPGLLLPAYGVYAVRAWCDGVVMDGVANLGVRPTIAVGNRPSLEVHLFDTVQEIYGKTLEVSLVGRLRGEMKFAGLEALTAQIAHDSAMARTLLASTV
jgi:riboflavin kinase / FMN adenylyltransferase